MVINIKKIKDEIFSLSLNELMDNNKQILKQIYNLNKDISDFLSCFKTNFVYIKDNNFEEKEEKTKFPYKCQICERGLLEPVIHHKDGNKLNNDEENLIDICLDCHTAIHNGISNLGKRKGKIRDYRGLPKIQKKIINLSNYYHLNKGGNQK